jgi:hypothetical protein
MAERRSRHQSAAGLPLSGELQSCPDRISPEREPDAQPGREFGVIHGGGDSTATVEAKGKVCVPSEKYALQSI